MRKKLSFVLGAGALTQLMSSCFVLQSFAVIDYTLTAGQGTKARFNLRPTSIGAFPGPQFVFVIVGVPTPLNSQMVVGKATWGTNGLFGGPLPMPANGALVAAGDGQRVLLQRPGLREHHGHGLEGVHDTAEDRRRELLR